MQANMQKKGLNTQKKTQHKRKYYFLTILLAQAGARAPTTQHDHHFRVRAGHNATGRFLAKQENAHPGV